jgi:2',3'-cyclic-nucleotide 2'-phosphodiesterase (5'-nucleotidase family)
MHPFGNIVCKLAVTGRVILDALNFGVSRLPAAAGQFPQVSGLAVQLNLTGPPERRVQNVRLDGRPLDPAATYTLAIPDYLLNGGDGYTMFGSQQVLVGPESGDSIATALEAYVAGRGEINPTIEGRITVVQ